MQQIDTIVVIEFQRDPDEPHSKLWKRLAGVSLEQRLALPIPVLAQDNLLELALDEKPRLLRVDCLHWEHVRQTMHVHVALTEETAADLRPAGLAAWRPWIRRRAIESFLARCRRSGWTVRGAVDQTAPTSLNTAERIEPTL